MTAWLLWCTSVWGLSCLAAGMSKHQRDLFQQPVSNHRTLMFKIVGWGILLCSVISMIYIKSSTIAIPEWLGCLSLAALLVAWTITYQAKYFFVMNMSVLVIFIANLLLKYLI